MTCIVGIEHGGCVVLGGDRAVSDEDQDFRSALDHAKVWSPTEGLVIGGCGDLVGLQSVRFRLTCPKLTAKVRVENATEWVFLELRPAIIDALDGRTDTDFLVGLRGRLYYVSSSMEVCHVGPEYAAGSGRLAARGALFASKARTPRHRIMAALNAAAHCCDSVAPPFDIVES